MKASLVFPNAAGLAAYHQAVAQRPFSYAEQGATAQAFPPGYDHDTNRICIGSGQPAFEAGKQALLGWQQYPSDWTHVYPARAALRTGESVVVLFRLFGLWWHNACRIVYTFDEPLRFGFAYGTLAGHVEKGEERFMVYMDESGKVWYQIDAFSRPAVWVTRFSYPLARHFQRRFVQQSMELMQDAGQAQTHV